MKLLFKKLHYLLVVIVLFQACTPSQKPQFRILVGGIQHESNTFCPIPTSEEDFRILREQEIINSQDWLKESGKMNIEIIIQQQVLPEMLHTLWNAFFHTEYRMQFLQV